LFRFIFNVRWSTESESRAEFLYKTTNYYSPESEGSIIWNDKKVSVVWPIDISPSLAMKDSSSPNFEDAALFD
jgi:dTDP-4-dehydrorhamnose 3,5-epimerase